MLRIVREKVGRAVRALQQIFIGRE